MRYRRRSRSVPLASILLVAACSRAPRDPVLECLNGAAKAAEARDADGVLARLSSAYRDAEGGKAEAALSLKRYFAAYESLSISLAAVTLRRGDSSARARFTVRMSGRPRAVAGLDGILPRASRWRFDVRLEAEGDGWKISEAAWEPLESD
ncbi:MAG TPA: hypothetical protein PLB02_11550 [Thermoanaerobaculia bacterium]|nr:hypothetical protein [Thermoanaerobaculia bacterium]HQR68022.1 hypothetical protein [Thermoanaerobaculia bacterium]